MLNDNNIIYSEEDIKNKVVLPFLKSLSFSENDLSFEYPLTVKIGTKKHKIDNKAGGRIDILCKINNKNLFVIEVKKDNKKISEEDIDQGISYARLLHPIPPYIIITNGKTTKVFDSYQKIEVKLINENIFNSLIKGKYNIAVEDDLRMRYEALQKFIGYSVENIKVFSEGQIHNRILPLLGSKDNITKKYIPELFVKRINLDYEFENFLNSDSKCFAIIGESGVGKTNVMCNLAYNIPPNNISLFFNGTQISETIINSIKNDLNLFFSQQLDSLELLKKLSSLFEDNNHKICIFIDAIDEVKYENFELEISELISKVNNFSNIKICISCKINDWKRFTAINGQPTYTFEYLYRKEPFLLSRFDDIEIETADLKYRELFKYHGDLNINLKKEIKLGILFRVLAEVYENKKLPDDFNELKLFEAFFKKKCEKIDSEKAYNVLREIGKTLIQNDTEFEWRNVTGLIEEDLLRKNLNLKVTDKLIPDFFLHNILERYEMEDGKYIGFYYRKFKDYVISIISYGLDKSYGKTFRDKLNELMKGHNGQEAISWYLNNAGLDQINVFNDFYYHRALEFINNYNNILNEKLNQIKDLFAPYTENDIGVIIPKIKDFDMIGYALREINQAKQEKVKVIDKLHMFYNELFDKYDVQYYTEGRKNFMTIGSKKASVNEITKQLENIVEKKSIDLRDFFKGLSLPLPDLDEEEIIKEKGVEYLNHINYAGLYNFYSEEQLKSYLESFFEMFLNVYSKIIETKFNNIKNLFPIYSRLPCYYYVEVFTKIELTSRLRVWPISHGIKNIKVNKSKVEVCLNPKIPRFLYNNEFLSGMSQMLKPFFSRFNQTTLDSFDDLTNIKNLRPLKEFIQEELKREIKTVCKELEKIYTSPIN